MKLLRCALPVAVGLLLSVAGRPAQAQIIYQRPYTNPYGTPTVSPYLNLLRGGTLPGINYYGLVRPQFQTNAALRSLQNQVSANTTSIIDEQTGLPLTGHPVQFLNTTHYFFNTTGGPGTTTRTGAPTALATGGTGARAPTSTGTAPGARRP